MATYIEHENNFDSGKSTKIQIWNIISQVLAKMDFQVEPGNSELMTAKSSSSDEPTPKRRKKSSKKNNADQLEKISSHMAEFNDIFKDLVKAENEKNALLQKLSDK
ncbi:uncharacterized protein LOC111029692 [Myzus persicae]|uniref:uncharacterized protein LOC111029692 n=1 Tax=Myzus persicae TaxID=13164 RepID=UPI000B936ED8|nr:uncharacterized protein LOC111029692 [Myzus persicae]